MPNDTPSPTLTPEVLEELRKAMSDMLDAQRRLLEADLPHSELMPVLDAEARFEFALRRHAPALLAAAQRVQELEAEREQVGPHNPIALIDKATATTKPIPGYVYASEAVEQLLAPRDARIAELEESARVHAAELTAIDDALGPLTEATRQAQVRGLVEDRARLDWLERLRAKVAELEGAVTVMAIPYEALRMDEPSRQWIAPQVWDHIVKATETARAIVAARQAGKEEGT